MELIAMILVPAPLGFLVRNRLAACVAYTALHAFLFTFQTLMLILEWANGSTEAFGSFPNSPGNQGWSYGVVNLAIYVVGLVLVSVGHRIGSRRRSRSDRGVSLDPVM